MALISVLIVFVLEYYFRWGSEYRSFNWFTRLQEMLDEQFSLHSFWQRWTGVALLLLTPLCILWALVSFFSASIFLLIISSFILFISIGPKIFSSSLKGYFEAMERGDEQAAFFELQKESNLDNLPESDELIRNTTRFILAESQTRYFGVIFWFIFTGPFGALFYRLAHLYYASSKQNANDEHYAIMSTVIHWIDWAPARLTSLLFLLTGDFVNGFYRVKDYMLDLDADNHQLISETGISALGIDIGMSSGDIKENEEALAMVDRTIIVYIVVVALLSPLSFW